MYQNEKPGMFPPGSIGAKIIGILLGSALGFLIIILICSCSKQENPYDNIDLQMIALHDEIILREIRQTNNILDSARIKSFKINEDKTADIVFHDDTSGVGTLGILISRKMPPDSVLIIRRNGIAWAFWCKHWFGHKLDFKDVDKWIIKNKMLRNKSKNDIEEIK